jgi:hypothetical protein
VAAALLAASAFAASNVRAAGPSGPWRDSAHPGALAAILGQSWVELELGGAALPLAQPFGTVRAPQVRIAGATLRNLNGWSASLFVTRALNADLEEGVTIPDSTAVNARLARRIARGTTLTFEAFNVFDRRLGPRDQFVASQLWSPSGVPENFLVRPGEARGFRVGIRWSFR